jgi:transposase-like protein
MPSYDEKDKRKAAQTWRQNGRNLSSLARRDDMPSRSMLWRWKKAGVPEELTGGDDWETWADRADSRNAEAERERERRRAERENMSEIEAHDPQSEGLEPTDMRWPIPQTEIDAAGDLGQNPGY